MPLLLEDLRRIIDETRQGVATTVNTALTLLYWAYWKNGLTKRFSKAGGAEYGQQILATLSQELVQDYGNGFSAKNIHHMIRFNEAFPDIQIVSTLSRQLSWSHFKEIIYLNLHLQKDFYAEMCRLGALERSDIAKENRFHAL